MMAIEGILHHFYLHEYTISKQPDAAECEGPELHGASFINIFPILYWLERMSEK